MKCSRFLTGVLAVMLAAACAVSAGPLQAEASASRVRRVSKGGGDAKSGAEEGTGMIHAFIQRSSAGSEYDRELGMTKEIRHDEIVLAEETKARFPELESTIENYNRVFRERSASRAEEFTETIRYYQEEDYPLYLPLQDIQEIYIRRADAAAFSFVRFEETYDGGVHGYYSYFGVTTDPVSGQTVTLGEIINDVHDLPEILAAELEEKYPDIVWFDLRETLEDYAKNSEYDNGPDSYFTWCLDPEGLTFFFNPYELASYADGAQEVTLFFDEYPELFTGIYGASKEGYALNFGMYEDICFDAGGDGLPDALTVTAEADEYGTYQEICFRLNGEDYYVDDLWAYDIEPVLLCTDAGECWLYIQLTEENDYRQIDVYDLNTGEPVYAETIDAGIDAYSATADDLAEGWCLGQITDPDSFYIDTRIQIMSTMSGSMHCSVGRDGTPQHEEELWKIRTGIVFSLKQDTEFARISETGRVIDEEARLAKGTKLTPYRTDAESFVDVVTSDGSIYRVFVDAENGWPQMINGIELDDLLDGIMFAG